MTYNQSKWLMKQHLVLPANRLRQAFVSPAGSTEVASSTTMTGYWFYVFPSLAENQSQLQKKDSLQLYLTNECNFVIDSHVYFQNKGLWILSFDWKAKR